MLAAMLNPRPKAVHRPWTIEDQAHALNILLRKEFGNPFAFHDANTGLPIENRLANASESWRGLPQDAFPPSLPVEEVKHLASDKQTDVLALADGRYRLALVFCDGAKPNLVASGLFNGLAKNQSETDREQKWLRHWLKSVGERLQLTEQIQKQQRNTSDQHAQAKMAWEGLLALDHVVRRLRIHKEPARNRQRVLETLHSLLGTQMLAWVPKEQNGTVQIAGQEILTLTDCRLLATLLVKHTDLQETGHFLCNEPQGASWSAGFPSLGGLIAFAISDADVPGWLLAINKRPVSAGESASPFRRSDIALATPFVGVLQFHASAAGRYQNLKDLMVGLARSLTSAIDAKDSYTFGHSERVGRIAVELGRGLGLEPDDLSDLFLTGLLHDVGKIGIRDNVLRKVDPLTAEEFDHIKQHVTIGYTILADLKPIHHLLPGVLYHHERWDGKGYPDGLAGEAIPFMARILAVADAYDAMSSNRPYREALPCREVEDRLGKGSGIQWDAKVIEAFMRCRQKIHTIRQRGVGESLRTALDAALRVNEVSMSMTL